MSTGDEGEERKGKPEGRPTGGDNREKLTPREVLQLIIGTYKVSLPYLLVFLAGILLATWILTELVF